MQAELVFVSLKSLCKIFSIMALLSKISFQGLFIILVWSLKSNKCHIISDGNFTENVKSNTVINLLNVAESSINTAKEVAKVRTSHVTESTILPMDCAEIQQLNASTKSGIYKIWPRSRVGKGPITAYCDMDDDGGAWTVIQRRGDFDSSKDFFYRNWTTYKNGFGDVSKDFWIGNDNIFSLTSQRASSIKFILRDWERNQTYAEYEDFWIDDETRNYQSHVEGFRGNTGNGFGSTNGLFFTTQDRDNDLHPQNCAVLFKGAWWYEKCHSSNLNGQYLKGVHESYADGVNWSSFRGNHYSLKDAVIKIRPKYFVKKLVVEATPE